MMEIIILNQRHPLYGAQHLPSVPVRVARGALVAHPYTYAPLHYRTLQYLNTFIPLSVFCGTILLTLYSRVWDRLVSRAGPMPFYCPS